MKHIVVYKFKKIEPKTRLQFNRELYGFIDYSNKGKYHYHREGILSKDDYEKLSRGVLLIKKKLNAVLEHLKRYNADYRVFKIS